MPLFDGDNLIMTLDAPIAGVLNLDTQADWYSEWKKWQLIDDNMRYEDAFEIVISEELTPGIESGAYFFFMNSSGWRVRPFEADATIYLNGNLVPRDSTLPIMIPTIGAFTVLIDGLQPITQNVDTILTQSIINSTNLQFLIESVRAEASVFGNVWYWNPVSGSDSNDGTQPTTAFKTFAFAQSVATANNSDGIFIVHDSGAALVITERLMITKNDIILRGPGSSVLFQPLDDAGPTIHVNADNVSLSGFKAVTTGATPQAVIHSTGGDGLSIQNLWISSSTEAGIHGENGEDTIIKNCTIESCAGEGIHLLNAINAKIHDNRIQRNTGSGIELDETTTARDSWVARNVFHHNGPASINIGAGVSMTVITKDNYFGPRPGTVGGDDIIDNGSATHNEYQDQQDMMAEAIWGAIVEPQGNLTAKDVQNIGLAALAGQVSVSPDGNTITFKTPDGVLTRMVSTTDASGNRSNIVLTPAA